MKYYKSKINWINVKDNTPAVIYYKTNGKEWWQIASDNLFWKKCKSLKNGSIISYPNLIELSEKEMFIEIL